MHSVLTRSASCRCQPPLARSWRLTAATNAAARSSLSTMALSLLGNGWWVAMLDMLCWRACPPACQLLALHWKASHITLLGRSSQGTKLTGQIKMALGTSTCLQVHLGVKGHGLSMLKPL